MIPRIQGYGTSSNYSLSCGSAVVAKGAKIALKHRGENIPKNVGNNFFSNLKEIFYEMFPKLDSEYKNLKF